MIVRPRRAAPVLVCRKCLKRSDEGRDVRRALKSELKANKRDGTKPAKLIVTGCFGLCPKQSIVIASGAEPGAAGICAGCGSRSGAAGARVVGRQARRVTVGPRRAENSDNSLALPGDLLHSGGKETNA